MKVCAELQDLIDSGRTPTSRELKRLAFKEQYRLYRVSDALERLAVIIEAEEITTSFGLTYQSRNALTGIGVSAAELADKLGISSRTVVRIRTRFRERGVAGVLHIFRKHWERKKN